MAAISMKKKQSQRRPRCWSRCQSRGCSQCQSRGRSQGRSRCQSQCRCCSCCRLRSVSLSEVLWSHHMLESDRHRKQHLQKQYMEFMKQVDRHRRRHLAPRRIYVSGSLWPYMEVLPKSLIIFILPIFIYHPFQNHTWKITWFAYCSKTQNIFIDIAI